MANYGSGVYATSTYGVAPVPAKATYGVSTYGNAASTYVRLDPLFTAVSRFGLFAYVSDLAIPYIAFSKMASESEFYAYGFKTNEGPQSIMISTSYLDAPAEIPAFNNSVFTAAKFITANDPFRIDAVSSFDASYTIDIVLNTVKLASITEFKADQLIEAAAMSTNFKLIAAVIGFSSGEDELNTQPSVGFEDSATNIVELSESGLMLSRQAKIDYSKTIEDPALRLFASEGRASTALYIDGNGFRILSSKAPRIATDNVVLSDIMRIENSKIMISGPLLNRGLFQPLETPILINSINKQITGLQEFVINTERDAAAVEISIRVGTTSQNAVEVLVYGSEESLGYRLYVPAVPTQPSIERFVTRRVRIPIEPQAKKLRIKLSAVCSTAEIRVVGTWS